MRQQPLFGTPIRDPVTRRGLVPNSAAARFATFHHANPQVYATLVRLAREAKQRGMERVGIKMLWEVMRWELWLPTVDENSEYKLNNNYHSRYARLIMHQEPDLRGMFKLRRLKS